MLWKFVVFNLILLISFILVLFGDKITGYYIDSTFSLDNPSIVYSVLLFLIVYAISHYSLSKAFKSREGSYSTQNKTPKVVNVLSFAIAAAMSYFTWENGLFSGNFSPLYPVSYFNPLFFIYYLDSSVRIITALILFTISILSGREFASASGFTKKIKFLLLTLSLGTLGILFFIPSLSFSSAFLFSFFLFGLGLFLGKVYAKKGEIISAVSQRVDRSAALRNRARENMSQSKDKNLIDISKTALTASVISDKLSKNATRALESKQKLIYDLLSYYLISLKVPGTRITEEKLREKILKFNEVGLEKYEKFLKKYEKLNLRHIKLDVVYRLMNKLFKELKEFKEDLSKVILDLNKQVNVLYYYINDKRNWNELVKKARSKGINITSFTPELEKVKEWLSKNENKLNEKTKQLDWKNNALHCALAYLWEQYFSLSKGIKFIRYFINKKADLYDFRKLSNEQIKNKEVVEDISLLSFDLLDDLYEIDIYLERAADLKTYEDIILYRLLENFEKVTEEVIQEGVGKYTDLYNDYVNKIGGEFNLKRLKKLKKEISERFLPYSLKLDLIRRINKKLNIKSKISDLFLSQREKVDNLLNLYRRFFSNDLIEEFKNYLKNKGIKEKDFVRIKRLESALGTWLYMYTSELAKHPNQFKIKKLIENRPEGKIKQPYDENIKYISNCFYHDLLRIYKEPKEIKYYDYFKNKAIEFLKRSSIFSKIDFDENMINVSNLIKEFEKSKEYGDYISKKKYKIIDNWLSNFIKFLEKIKNDERLDKYVWYYYGLRLKKLSNRQPPSTQGPQPPLTSTTPQQPFPQVPDTRSPQYSAIGNLYLPVTPSLPSVNNVNNDELRRLVIYLYKMYSKFRDCITKYNNLIKKIEEKEKKEGLIDSDIYVNIVLTLFRKKKEYRSFNGIAHIPIFVDSVIQKIKEDNKKIEAFKRFLKSVNERDAGRFCGFLKDFEKEYFNIKVSGFTYAPKIINEAIREISNLLKDKSSFATTLLKVFRSVNTNVINDNCKRKGKFCFDNILSYWKNHLKEIWCKYKLYLGHIKNINDRENIKSIFREINRKFEEINKNIDEMINIYFKLNINNNARIIKVTSDPLNILYGLIWQIKQQEKCCDDKKLKYYLEKNKKFNTSYVIQNNTKLLDNYTSKLLIELGETKTGQGYFMYEQNKIFLTKEFKDAIKKDLEIFLEGLKTLKEDAKEMVSLMKEVLLVVLKNELLSKY